MEMTTKLGTTWADGAEQSAWWLAVQERDRRADGRFVMGVRSTKIFCKPSCPARRPLPENVIFFRTGGEAAQAGFRPCKRCKPEEVPQAAELIRKAAALLSDEEEGLNLNVLAKKLGSSPANLRRAFRSSTGLSPKEFVEAVRLEKFKKLLRAGTPIADALYACGYGSSSRVYERSDKRLGMTPATYRRGGAGMRIGYVVAESSLGKVLVAATERGVSAVYLGANEGELAGELKKEYPKAEIHRGSEGEAAWVKEVVNRIESCAPKMELPLDLEATAFQRRVWNELQKIPSGVTRTYTQVAAALKMPRSARAVARACATNPVSIIVPCHRVIRGDGKLAGYRWGMERKSKLLEREKALLVS